MYTFVNLTNPYSQPFSKVCKQYAFGTPPPPHPPPPSTIFGLSSQKYKLSKLQSKGKLKECFADFLCSTGKYGDSFGN